MSDEPLTMPPERNYGFYQRRKHDKWREVPAPSPQLEAPIADTHAHVHMLPEPEWELERAAANSVQLISCVADPTEDILDGVFALADYVNGEAMATSASDTASASAKASESELGTHPTAAASATAASAAESASASDSTLPDSTLSNSALPDQKLPQVVFTVGVHPHNAKDYSPEVEKRLVDALAHPLTRALGEIGLDYHYDLSPREIQREVFRKQLRLAHELGLPVALHLRSGEDPEADNAHREAFAILQEEGFPENGTLLHCCSLDAEQLKPWIDADCHIAYGGALTFKKSDAAREATALVPIERLLLETDSPYMAPEPMRGTTCTPAHTIFTAEVLADARGVEPGPERQAFLETIWENSNRFFKIETNA